MEELKTFNVEVEVLDQPSYQCDSKETTLANEKWAAAPRYLKILANIALDFLLIAIAALTAYVSCGAFSRIMQTSEVSSVSDSLPTQILQGVVILTVMSGFLLFTLQDLIKLFNRKQKLPFELSLDKAGAVYWRRTQIHLLAASFNAILLCLYLSFPSMAVVSGIFLASVFSLAILAIQKSAPIPKIGFYLSLFFLVLVIAAIPIIQTMYTPVNTSEAE